MNKIRDAIGTVFIPFALMGSIATNVYLSNKNASLHREVVGLNTQLDDSKFKLAQNTANVDAVKATTDQVNRSIQCVLAFFSLPPPRANLQVTDLSTCTIIDTVTRQTQVIDINQIQPGANPDPKAQAPTEEPRAQTTEPQPGPGASPSAPPTAQTPTPTPVPEPGPLPEPAPQPIMDVVMMLQKAIRNLLGGLNGS